MQPKGTLMTYAHTPHTMKALQIAYAAHDGQTDRSGMPYINHPLYVAAQMDTPDEACVGLLHDVVEDSSWTLEDLAREGMPPQVVEAVGLLTHDPQVPYLDYVRGLEHNPLAKKVKIADLRHNSSRARLGELTERDEARMAKYAEALRILGA